MRNYPSDTVRQLLDSDFVTEATRQVLRARLRAGENYAPQFFDVAEFDLLKAICEAFAPSQAVSCGFVVAEIDRRLAEGNGNGWRYDEMPPDGEAFKRGLAGFNRIAKQIFQTDFVSLDAEKRRLILRNARDGQVTINELKESLSARFVEELLTEFAETFYSHPLAQGEIGCVAMADAAGWREIGLNRLDSHEPRSVDGADKASFEAPVFPAKNHTDFSPDDEVLHKKLPMKTYSTGEIVDAVIIGTGASGAAILARLATAGLKVVALEAGKHFDVPREFATDEREQSKIFWLDERLSAGETPTMFGSNNSGCGVGGTMLHFTAYTPRAQADDFRLRTEFGVAVDWDLDFAELEPYYAEVEEFIGVSGPANYPWGGRRGKNYPLPPLPLNGAAELMRRACRELDIQTAPAPNAALSRDYFREEIGWRRACTNRGFCQAGCTTGAKGSVDVTYLPLAVKNGAEIRAESFVTEFETNESGRISAVVYVRDGKIERQKCRNVFLCAGAIETPRLLLINDLANRSGQVGKNFMAHTGVQVWGVFDEDVRPYKGIPGGLISEETHRPQKRFGADFAGGYLLQSIGVMPVTYVSQLARGQKVWGEELNEWMTNYNHTAGINILGDCLPYERNYLELSEEKDARGLPKPRVHFSAGENEKKMTRHAEQLMREIWTAAGVRRMWTYDRYAHTIGTCRMGNNPETSVVNTEGKSFDIENLYIADNSIFPTALSVNPALTILALALRIADKFLEKQKRGEIF